MTPPELAEMFANEPSGAYAYMMDAYGWPLATLLDYGATRGLGTPKYAKGIFSFAVAKGYEDQWGGKKVEFPFDESHWVDQKGMKVKRIGLIDLVNALADAWVPPPMMPDGVTPWQDAKTLYARLEAAPEYHVDITVYAEFEILVPPELEGLKHVNIVEWQRALNNGQRQEVFINFEKVVQWGQVKAIKFLEYTENGAIVEINGKKVEIFFTWVDVGITITVRSLEAIMSQIADNTK